jgi:hypothetical protein
MPGKYGDMFGKKKLLTLPGVNVEGRSQNVENYTPLLLGCILEEWCVRHCCHRRPLCVFVCVCVCVRACVCVHATST